MQYVTHLVKADGSEWEGPLVEASSWEEAEESCRRIGITLTEYVKCILVGEFVIEIEYEGELAYGQH